jgi:serine-type D-Ala-D-Ala carboxypeptidase/endopeptidase (penicillin-binding protein 4)
VVRASNSENRVNTIKLKSKILLLSTLLFLGGCASVSSEKNPANLPQSIADALAAAQLPLGSLSVVVAPLGGGADLLRIEADRASAPASVMKLPTTLAALEMLGPAFRSSVQLWSAAPQQADRLRGDLVVRGRGHVEFGFSDLEALLAKLRAQGIREIEGDIVIDRSYFSPQRMDVGVPQFDESPEFRYNIIPDAMMVNQNLITLHISSNENEVRLLSVPALPNVMVKSELSLNDARCADWEDSWKIPQPTISANGAMTLTLQGAFPKNCTRVEEINALDRDGWIEGAIRSVWTQRLGGAWAGRVRAAALVEAGARKLAEQHSRLANALVRDANKSSDNAITRTLFLQLGVGYAQGSEPSLLASERRMRTWLRGIGIDHSKIVFENGSGLSRTERIPAAQLAKLLQYAASSPWSHEFIASLPIAGIDGTMRNRLLNSAAKGKARVKTGTLRDVVSVAGYVPDANGKMYVVVAMVNDPRASHRVARPVVDALIDWVANLK